MTSALFRRGISYERMKALLVVHLCWERASPKLLQQPQHVCLAPFRALDDPAIGKVVDPEAPLGGADVKYTAS